MDFSLLKGAAWPTLGPLNSAALLLGAGAVAVLVAAGTFRKIRFVSQQVGPFVLFGKEYKGQYQKVGPSFAEAEVVRKALGVERLGGIYYDDPHTVPADKCRAFVGVLCTEAEAKAHSAHLLGAGFQRRDMPQCNAFVCRWTFPQCLEHVAIPIAMMRIYPAMGRNADMTKACVGCFEVYEPQCSPFATAVAMVCVATDKEHVLAFTHPDDK